MDEANTKKHHTWVSNTPGTWESCADTLLLGASVLAQKSRLHQEFFDCPDEMAGSFWMLRPVEFMLRGMAVECLMKALWVKGGNALSDDGEFKKTPGSKSGHDLVPLSKANSFPLSAEEEELLVRLSDFIKYGGRYPAPRKWNEYMPMDSQPGGRNLGLSWTTPTDDQLFVGIVARLKGLIEQPSTSTS